MHCGVNFKKRPVQWKAWTFLATKISAQHEAPWNNRAENESRRCCILAWGWLCSDTTFFDETVLNEFISKINWRCYFKLPKHRILLKVNWLTEVMEPYHLRKLFSLAASRAALMALKPDHEFSKLIYRVQNKKKRIIIKVIKSFFD